MSEENFEYSDKIKGKDHREVLERIDDEISLLDRVAANVAAIESPTTADSIPVVAAKINDIINALVTAGLMTEAE